MFWVPCGEFFLCSCSGRLKTVCGLCWAVLRAHGLRDSQTFGKFGGGGGVADLGLGGLIEGDVCWFGAG